jgi:hypothetical protein
MEIIKEIVTNYYYPILVIGVISLLALIGYLVDNLAHKDFVVNAHAKRKVVDETDLSKINVTENKSMAEMINSKDTMSGLNNDNTESLN